MRVLIGGVGYHWSRDASFGLVAVEELARRQWPAGVDVACLDYGALYVAQDLADARPPHDRLILIAGVERGRAPGSLTCRRWIPALPGAGEIQARIREAGAGVIDLDHLLVIACYLGALPDDVVLVEVEPVETTGGPGLSPAAEALLPEVMELVRREALAANSAPITVTAAGEDGGGGEGTTWSRPTTENDPRAVRMEQ